MILFSFVLSAQDTGSAPVTTAVPEIKKLKIAVPDFVYSNDPLNTAAVFYPAFVEELKKNSGFEIIDKDEYEKLLKENKLESSACRTTACMGKAAKTLLLDKIITGMITKSMGRYSVDINVFDKDTNEVKSTEYFKIQSLTGIKTEAAFAATKIAAGISVSKKGESKFDEMVRKFETKSTKEKTNSEVIKFGLGGYLGLSTIMTPDAYSGYTLTGGALGLVFNFRIENAGRMSPLSIGIAVDDMPLVLPEFTNGQAEDIIGVTLFFCYNIFPSGFLNPYVGIGVGGYFDMISTVTGAAGTLSTMYFFMGGNGKAGLEINIDKTISLFVEVKMHYLLEYGKGVTYSASHLNYGGGVILYIF